MIVTIAGLLRFHVVVADFQQGAHDWRPLVHWTYTHGPPLSTQVIIPIDILVHTDVHQIPFITKRDGAMIQNTPHIAIIIDDLIGVINFGSIRQFFSER
ncbi:Uncharacterised protein [Salmonella enterica subsp. enterica serovar Bovismorbificans]|nr:Uncharacterised protein [Salmonella enterica subsp. enterica serovar Bovismorbificans]